MANTQEVPSRAGSVMTTTSSTPHPPSAPPPTPPAPGATGDVERRSGGFLVALIVGGVVFATVLMVSFIWYRWNGVHEPTTAVIVQGDATLDGTEITVTGGRRPEHTTLDPGNSYRAAVLVEPGRYRVTAERKGVLLLRQNVDVKRFLAVQFDLTRMTQNSGAGTTTGPSGDGESAYPPAPTAAPSLPRSGAGSP
jgi:hypothetical protein